MIYEKQTHESEAREQMRGGNGTVWMKKLAKNLPANLRLFNEISLDPGVSIGYHVHEGETELFYFTEGKGRVADDDQFFDVCAGDTLLTSSGHGHSVENTGDTPLRMLAVIVMD